jgi:hypothetical protein
VGDLVVGNENGEFICVVKDSPKQILGQNFSISCMTVYNAGFVVAGEKGFIFVYKYLNDDSDPFECIVRPKQRENTEPKDNFIKGISISPVSFDKVVIQMSNNSIYMLKLHNEYHNINAEYTEDQLELVSNQFH